MKPLFTVGDKKEFRKIVSAEDFASFHGEIVHPVCATFSLARDVEWTTRQFVLDMRDVDEEGIGTFISIEHKSPAFEGEEIVYRGYIDRITNNELICSVEAYVGERLIATAKTGQKILKREKIKKLFEKP
jgi:fluoroacetyl-CoA thioesterase